MVAAAAEQILGVCFADRTRVDPAMFEAAVALAEHRRPVPGCDESLLAAARSLMRIVAHCGRYEAMMAAIGVPVLLIGVRRTGWFRWRRSAGRPRCSRPGTVS
jgi:hypothetical protein